MVKKEVIKSKFGVALKTLRITKDLTQKEFADAIGISRSQLQLFELDKNPSGEQQLNVWVEKINKHIQVHKRDTELIRHDELEKLIVAAGLRDSTTMRFISIEKQRKLQEDKNIVPDNSDIWVLAKKILDLEPPTYNTVMKNLLRGVHYTYFLPSDAEFQFLKKKLSQDIKGDNFEKSKLKIECIVCPDSFFFTSFVVFNPGGENMRGYTALLARNKPIENYAMDAFHVDYVYEVLKQVVASFYETNEGETTNLMGTFYRKE